MAISIPSRNARLACQRTVAGKSYRSVHGALALVFNASASLHLARACFLFRRELPHRPAFLALAGLVVFALAAAAFLMWRIYRQTREQAGRPEDAQAILDVSYRAFRLYILLLGLTVVLLAVFDAAFSR